MAVRFRKYFSQCKPIQCGSKRSKTCPQDLPRKANGELKACGVWCIEFFDDKKKWQSLTFKDIRCRADAEKRLTLFISDRERGRLNLPKKKVMPTLSEYSKQYLGLYRDGKENTKKQKKWAVGILTAYLGNYRLDKLSPFVIERFRLDYREKNKVGNSVINDCVFALSHILNMAIKGRLIDKNPCKDVKRLKVAQTRDRVLSSEEISLLLSKLQGKDRMMVLLGLLCGLRLNETLNLRWSDFDFQKGLLTFVASKTGKLITVPLSGLAIRELSAYKETSTTDYLFEVRVIHKVVASYSFYFSNLFKKLGICDFTYHSLRHTFASFQADIGTGAVTTMGLLGHSSLDMTLRYSHTGLDSKRQAIESMSERILQPPIKVSGTA